MSGAGSGRRHPGAPHRTAPQRSAPSRASGTAARGDPGPARPLLGCGWHRSPEGEDSGERRLRDGSGRDRGAAAWRRGSARGAPAPGPAGSSVPPLRLRGRPATSGAPGSPPPFRNLASPRAPPCPRAAARRSPAARIGRRAGGRGGAVRRGVKVSWRARVRGVASGRSGGAAHARGVARVSGGRRGGAGGRASLSPRRSRRRGAPGSAVPGPARGRRAAARPCKQEGGGVRWERPALPGLFGPCARPAFPGCGRRVPVLAPLRAVRPQAARLTSPLTGVTRTLLHVLKGIVCFYRSDLGIFGLD